MTEQLYFDVSGSAAEPYRVTINRKSGMLKATCTCPAGQMATLCKRRLRILGGSTANLVDLKQADMDTLSAWLSGSQVEQELHALVAAEETLACADAALKTAKKRLGNLFRD